MVVRVTGVAQSVKGGDRTGRFGVMYLRALLAQAGIAHGEFSSGEDYLAVDVTLNFEHGAVRVQVKSGTTEPNMDGSITVPVEDAWKDKWSKCKLPVYLVYVRLEDPEPGGWVEHADLHTLVYARAHWVSECQRRIDLAPTRSMVGLRISTTTGSGEGLERDDTAA
jgi:hypothetical protein